MFEHSINHFNHVFDDYMQYIYDWCIWYTCSGTHVSLKLTIDASKKQKVKLGVMTCISFIQSITYTHEQVLHIDYQFVYKVKCIKGKTLCILIALLAILNDNLLQQSFKNIFVHTAVLYTVKRIKKILFITTNSAQYTMTATMMIMMI